VCVAMFCYICFPFLYTYCLVWSETEQSVG